MKTLLLFLLLMPSIMLAQWDQIGQTLLGDALGDRFGGSTAINALGDRMIVGAENANGIQGGSRVYEFDGANWTQIGQEIIGDNTFDFFGITVSMNAAGDIIAVGGYGPQNNTGLVRIYQYDGSTWVQLGQDIFGEAEEDFSARSISLDNDGFRIIVGAARNNGSSSNAGHARVYQYNGTSWVQIGQDIDGEAQNDFFGSIVVMSGNGNVVAIGAPFNEGNGTSSGHVRAYLFDGTNWNQIGQDIDGEAIGNQSSSGLSINNDGSVIAIGARFNDGGGNARGHARIFGFNGTNWAQLGQDIDGVADNDLAGESISISGDGSIVAIGSTQSNEGGTSAGQVRVFELIGSSWVQKGSSINGEASDFSGESVALTPDGSRLIIGAPSSDTAGNNAGQVKVYKFGFPPENNNPNTAEELQIGGGFDDFDVLGDNVDATNSETIFTFLEDTACGEYLGGDVWYTVTIPASGTVTIETQEDTGSELLDTAMAIYNEDGTLIDCNDDETPGMNFFSKLELSGQTPGATVFIRLWSYENAQFGTFKIAAYNATLNIDKVNLTTLSFYPNPTKDRITFEAKSTIASITFYNVLGQRVKQTKGGNTTVIADISDLPIGHYIAQIISMEGTKESVKIIKN